MQPRHARRPLPLLLVGALCGLVASCSTPMIPGLSQHRLPDDFAQLNLCNWMADSLGTQMQAGEAPYVFIRERSIADPLTPYRVMMSTGENRISLRDDPDRPAGSGKMQSVQCSYGYAKQPGIDVIDVTLYRGPWVEPSDRFFAADPAARFEYRGLSGYRSSTAGLKVRLESDVWLSLEMRSHIDIGFGGADTDQNYHRGIKPLAEGMVTAWESGRAIESMKVPAEADSGD